MKYLNGKELAGFIKERQAHEARSLIQGSKITPKLAIILTIDHPAINVYVRKKEEYGADLGILVEVHRVDQKDIDEVIAELNKDESVHGIIIQLPLQNPDETEVIVNQVAPEKDVDALGEKSLFEPATPMAILWLLAGYNIGLEGKRVVLVGKGKLVGKPLEKILLNSGVNVEAVDRKSKDVKSVVSEADVIISAAGSPSVLSSDMIKQGAVVIDAGVASEQGKTTGDLDPSIYEERDDLTLTPRTGGVGPLTVCALFENVIRSARRVVQAS